MTVVKPLNLVPYIKADAEKLLENLGTKPAQKIGNKRNF
jgi:hypothetical protein